MIKKNEESVDLIYELRNVSSMTALAAKLGVTDNAINKKLKKLGIDKKLYLGKR